MPSVLAQLLVRNPKLVRTSLQQPTQSQRTRTDSISEFPAEPRRSQRVRRPSTRKVESDEYQSSRGSSRSPSPQERTPNPKSKSKKHRSKKRAGKPGDRPGRIVQPASDTGSESDESSSKSIAPTRPEGGHSFLVAQDPPGDTLEEIDRAEAIRRATAFLGTNASNMSAKGLQTILEAISDNAKTTGSGPMEVEGGGTASELQPAHQVVLGSGYEPDARGTTNAANSSQGSTKHAAPTGNPASEPRLEGPSGSDTATVSEPESEFHELGPGDSVSQRVPLRSPPPGSPPLDSPPFGSPSPPPLQYPPHPPPAPIPGIHKYNNNDSDTATVDESDSEHELETVRTLKRQRLSPHPHTSRSPRPPAPQRNLSHSTSRQFPSRSTGSRPSTGVHSAVPPAATAPNRRQAISAAIHASPPSCLGQSQPPPLSDANGVLLWAARLAKQAACAHTSSDQGVGSSSRSARDAQPENSLGLLAEVLDNLERSRRIAPAPVVQLRAEQPRSHPRHAEPVEDDAAVLEAEATLVLGKRTRPRHQATLADFPGFPRHIATLAIPELIATAVTQGAYGEHGKLGDMATKVYGTRWAAELPDIRLQKAPPALIGLMTHRISWFRGEAAKRERPNIPGDYDLINPPRTPQDVQHNKKIVKKLLSNTFHCTNPYTDANQYENPALARCIASILFWAPDAYGTVFHKQFYPMPLPTVAMALTTMQHCISEWKTGRLVKRGLNVDDQRKVYKAHLKGLFEYAKPASQRLEDFRKDWFWYSVDYAGAALEDDDQPCQPITRADRVRPDTPAPDANAERHASAEGHRGSSGKGKGRVVP